MLEDMPVAGPFYSLQASVGERKSLRSYQEAALDGMPEKVGHGEEPSSMGMVQEVTSDVTDRQVRMDEDGQPGLVMPRIM